MAIAHPCVQFVAISATFYTHHSLYIYVGQMNNLFWQAASRRMSCDERVLNDSGSLREVPSAPGTAQVARQMVSAKPVRWV
jgi:hypothetical protein